MKRIHAAVLAAAACIPFAAAQAQDEVAQQVITLNVERGSVMVSDGAEFATAASGTRVAPGDRIMVAEEGVATLRYESGCSKLLETPGVYTVTDDCDPGSMVAAKSNTGLIIAGVVGGVAVLAAAGGGGGGDDRPTPPPPPPPPVSP